MKEFVSLKISKHAIERYRERVAALPASDFEATMHLFSLLMEAKPKHLDRLKKISEKRTTVIPVKDCFFIASFGVIVTVLDRALLDGNQRAVEAHAEASA